MNRIRKRLKKARKLVKRGWAQQNYRAYDYSTGGMCYCLTGAILAAGMKDPEDLGTPLLVDSLGVEAALSVADAAIPDLPCPDMVWGELANWNDAPERTQEEVLLAFDDAIAAEA